MAEQRIMLAESDIQSKLTECDGWSYRDGRLHVEYIFRNFSEAFSFMTQAAFVSEKLNHHPNWTNVYKRVTIELFTHDAGGVTDLDIQWAVAVGKIYKEYS